MSYPNLFTSSLLADDRAVFDLIHGRTAANPITISEIREQFRLGGHPITERRVKAIVRRLRMSGWPIGSDKGKKHGYFILITADDASKTSEALMKQARSMILAAKQMVGPHKLRELMGQMEIGA